MRLLLDTHCFLWMQAAPEKFSAQARELVESSDTELVLSAASAWEIAIKYALGKLALPLDPLEYVVSRARRSRVRDLPVSIEHALGVARLPPHHRDPFDRLLVAQSLHESLPILTADPQLGAYSVEIMPADKPETAG